MGGARAAVDDAAPRPGPPERRRPRAEAGQRPLPPAHEPRGSARRSRPVMDYLSRLASCANDIKLGSLPPSTVAAAKLVLLDTIGATAAAPPHPAHHLLTPTPPPPPPH